MDFALWMYLVLIFKLRLSTLLSGLHLYVNKAHVFLHLSARIKVKVSSNIFFLKQSQNT